MLLSSLLFIPILGIFLISSMDSFYTDTEASTSQASLYYKKIALLTSIINLIVSLAIFMLFDFSSNQFQFVNYQYEYSLYDIYLGVDSISLYFVLLTTIIFPIAIIGNWNSITDNVKTYYILLLLLETLLLACFLVLDIFLFYVFFESILPPLFLLIGIFGSSNRVRASFYLFLYTLFGSLFLLLAILTMSSIMGGTDMELLFKSNFDYTTQVFLFCGIFFSIAIKTPVYPLNTWLLKAHVESPLGGSIILAAIVLKLGLYGIIRLMLPIIPQATLDFTYIVYVIGIITVIYASFSTLRTLDIKELIAYSSVSHAAIYLMGVFSNTVQGIEGAIILGLAHGFASSGLFICAGGILYDRTGTRLISYYRGVTQMMPLFSILFFILCLANSGTPLTLNFVGEFLSLYGTFERLPILGALAASSIVFSAAYSIFLFNRVAFGGSFSVFFRDSFIDLTKREFFVLFTLVFFIALFGIYPSIILDGLHFNVSSLIYGVDYNNVYSSGVVPSGVRGYSTNSKPTNDEGSVEDESSLELPIQLDNENLDPWFVTGFADA